MLLNRFMCMAGLLIVGGCVGMGAGEKSSSILFQDGDTVAFLGDSITAGGAAYGKYCRLVVQGLKAKNIHIKPVMAGVPGNTTADMLARLDKGVLAHRPDWVVLAAGVNDVWHTDPTAKIGVFKPSPGMGVELPEYRENVKAILARCEAAGARVLLTTITPIREDPETNLNIKARDYNAFLLDLAQRRGLPIADLNRAMFAEIAKGRRLTSDGVHPLVAGDRVMAKGILQAIGFTEAEANACEEEWRNAPTILILGDRQTTSGTRTGAWCTLLMDGMNSGREMVTYRCKATYRQEVTVSGMLSMFRNIEQVNDRFVIVQLPRGDAVTGTGLEKYRSDLRALVTAIRDKGSRPVLVTIVVQDNNPAGELSRKCEPYNEVVRTVAGNMKVPLADINKAMVDHHEAEKNLQLTFDGERLNREGCVLMAETILRAVGLDQVITPGLRAIWKQHGFYAGS